MSEETKEEFFEENNEEETARQVPVRDEDEQAQPEQKGELAELNDKYVRLYAEFENYKRYVAKEREELIKYSNEGFMSDLLSVMDHLEMALQHSANNKASSGLSEGVELTLKELKTTLEKYGLKDIEALGKPFDPEFHHAMSQVETDESEENTVVTEFRKGYMLKDRVLRASLVGVSKKQSNNIKTDPEEE
ncbi:MAG TPA: nucleotide exchange factor GrpE [Nitrospirae bacterium]|nr:heat shock protein GrpE [bacterium BMS3Abin10]GBE38574.1 heat shock protein GrpE [bacterium BMS3Bbin08]HDH00332.1 nucleotide exchange factor GrpE [Nitrospirota bacterium]HDH50864.1 nucleotide exchange factor GrpE [Nitrospirota bacterium]HDK81563.1 nucleotide exchange factor GrpE [Nitrospirota bacterium]